MVHPAAAAALALLSWGAARVLPRVVPPLLAGAAHRRAPPPKCEGYWPDPEECLALGASRPPFHRRTRSNAGCPQWRMDRKWEGRGALSAKLRGIEGTAREWEEALDGMDLGRIERCYEAALAPVRIVRERGVAWSRVEEGVMAGNKEFHLVGASGACWTDALLPMYIDKFGVEPSDEFKLFVEGFDLDDFRARFDKLVECSEADIREL